MIDLNFAEVVRNEHAARIERANRDGWWLQSKRASRTPLRGRLIGALVVLGTKL
jgi:hypothetical protein